MILPETQAFLSAGDSGAASLQVTVNVLPGNQWDEEDSKNRLRWLGSEK
jgi:hypothetical protein